MEPSPLQTIEQYVAAARSGDWDAAFAFYAADVRFRIPGRSSFAGDHSGRDRAIAYIEHARALSDAEDVEVEVVDVLAGRERVALLVHERFHRASGTVDIRRANVYRVRDGQIVEVQIFEADQDAVDALFS
jgi:ketosteroid isomerase-like protein